MSQNLPVDWDVSSLQDVCSGTAQNGAFIKNPQWNSGTRFVNVRDTYRNVIVDFQAVERLRCDERTIEAYSLQVDDLLFVRSSLKREGIGQCCMVQKLEEPAIFDCHLIKVQPDSEKADSLFLAYSFLSERGRNDLIARSKTTTMTTISQKSLMESIIPLPPLPEQQQIAQTLQTVQQAKETRQRELELEQERKAALMQHLFTYGTRGEARKQTEIGEIPEGWEVVKLGNWCEFLQYGTSTRCDANKTETPVLRVPNVIRGCVDISDLKFIERTNREVPKLKLKIGDLQKC